MAKQAPAQASLRRDFAGRPWPWMRSAVSWSRYAVVERPSLADASGSSTSGAKDVLEMMCVLSARTKAVAPMVTASPALFCPSWSARVGARPKTRGAPSNCSRAPASKVSRRLAIAWAIGTSEETSSSGTTSVPSPSSCLPAEKATSTLAIASAKLTRRGGMSPKICRVPSLATCLAATTGTVVEAASQQLA